VGQAGSVVLGRKADPRVIDKKRMGVHSPSLECRGFNGGSEPPIAGCGSGCGGSGSIVVFVAETEAEAEVGLVAVPRLVCVDGYWPRSLTRRVRQLSREYEVEGPLRELENLPMREI